MIILYTIKEYAKLKGLSEIGVRKRISSNYSKSIIIDKINYIIEDDTQIKKLKTKIKNYLAKSRELKLKIEIKEEKNNDRYLEKLEEINKKLEEKIEKLEDKKDTMYEKFIGSVLNQKQIE